MADKIGWLTGTTHKAQGWRDADLATGRQGDVDLEIADDPVSVQFVRGGVAQTAQTVRLLQWPRHATEQGSEGGEQAEADVIVLGTSSLNVQRGDRFKADSQWYEVFYIEPEQENRTEALARQMQ